MKIRWRKLSFAPKDREYKISDSFSLDEVRDYLTQYLDGKILAINDYKGNKKRKRKKKEMNNTVIALREMSETQILIFSAAIIGYRVIKKFSDGEYPHWERIAVWRKSLYIMDYFEKSGQLKNKAMRFYKHKGFLFLCRIYNSVEGIGTVVLPETRPCRFTEWIPEPEESDDVPDPFYDMPPLLNYMGIMSKKEASKKIAEYVFADTTRQAEVKD